jgi:hypothetical protein
MNSPDHFVHDLKLESNSSRSKTSEALEWQAESNPREGIEVRATAILMATHYKQMNKDRIPK